MEKPKPAKVELDDLEGFWDVLPFLIFPFVQNIWFFIICAALFHFSKGPGCLLKWRF